MKKNLYYYDEEMNLAKLFNIRNVARLNCQTSNQRKKFIEQYKSNEGFLYGSEKELEKYCQDFSLDKENYYKII